MKRNYSLDLLKIIAILMIVMFHYTYKGIIYNQLTNFNKIIYSIVFHFGEIGVNLFMLITGYFLCKQEKINKNKVIRFILDVYFYSILSIIIVICFKKYVFSYQDLFPISFSYYWYITAYIIIYILSPYINKLIKSLTQKEYRNLLTILFIIFSVIPTFVGFLQGDTEGFYFYNRFVWLIYMYLIGSYICLYKDKLNILKLTTLNLVKKLFSLSIILILFIIFLFKLNIPILIPYDGIQLIKPYFMWQPNSILVFLVSTLIFLIFVKLNIKELKIIKLLSASTIGIYMLHEHHKFVSVLWYDILPVSKYFKSYKLYFYILFGSILVCLAGTVIFYIKKYTFDKLIDYLLNNINILNLRRKNEKTIK